MAADPSGWMADVNHQPTSAWGYPDIAEDGMFVQAVVSHVAQGYWGGLLGIAASQSPGKSWHFSISREGEIAQHVSIADPAWHAGDVNAPTWRLYQGGNPNKRTIGIEHEGFSIPPGYSYDYTYSAGNPWPEAMIAASIRVHQWVFARVNEWNAGAMVPSEDSVITHSMLNTASRRQDPGDLWLATVRPRIVAALQPTPVRRSYADGFIDGKNAALDGVSAALDALRK